MNALLHWWRMDAAASLVIVPFLLLEAKEAMTRECDCHDCRWHWLYNSVEPVDSGRLTALV